MTNQHWREYWTNKQEDHELWKKPSKHVLSFIESISPAEYPKVLDLGCGLGRHAIAFALAGHNVCATDATEEAVSQTMQWAEQLELNIDGHVCDMLAQPVEPGSMDVVLSYNVIYHGLREQYKQAIDHIHTLLRPGGLFWFTCHTRGDGKYGFGPEIAPHTFEAERSITPGDVHYFTSKEELDELLAEYAIESIELSEGTWNNKGTEQFFSNWIVLARKP